MKTIRISDNAHRELTRLLGEMMAKTRKVQTYRDVIDVLTHQSVILPSRLLQKIDASISENKKLDLATREEFVENAVTAFLQKAIVHKKTKTINSI